MKETLATLVEKFAANPQRSGRAMRELSEGDPGAFLAQAVDILRRLPKSQGLDYMLMLLAQDDYLVDILWHADLLTEAQAIDLATYVQRLDRQLSVRLGRRLAADSSRISTHQVGRMLEILAATADSMLLPLLLPYTAHPNQRIRSKVALMIGRVNHNAKWVESRLEDADARVRANAVESMWDVDTDDARALLWKAVQDQHHRVMANALYGLYRLGDPASIKQLIEMSGREDPLMQAASAWAMGESRDPRFLPLLREMAKCAEAMVNANAAKSIARIEAHLRQQAEAPALRVRLFAERRNAGGRRELWVGATTSCGITLPGLPPTAFSVFEDERLVTSYVVQESLQRKTLVVGFALPRPAPAAEDKLAAAIAGSLRYKNRVDQWAIVRYIPRAGRRDGKPTQSHDRLFGVEFDAAGEKTAPEAVTAKEMLDCGLSPSTTALKLKLGQAETRQDCAAGLDMAIRSLIAAVSRRPGHKHVVLLAASAGDCDELAGSQLDLAEQAQGLNIPIHVVAGPGVPTASFERLRDLAHKCGGRALRALRTDELIDAVSTLYLSFVHHYRIICQPTDENAAPSRTVVRVQSSDASGSHEIETGEQLDHPPIRSHVADSEQPAQTASLGG